MKHNILHIQNKKVGTTIKKRKSKVIVSEVEEDNAPVSSHIKELLYSPPSKRKCFQSSHNEAKIDVTTMKDTEKQHKSMINIDLTVSDSDNGDFN